MPPGDVVVVPLPRADVEGTLVAASAYRLVADRPVVVTQFNPFLDEAVFSNDASLVHPRSALGTEFVVLSWPQTATESVASSAWIAIVAMEAGTEVEVRVSAAVRASGGGPGDEGAPAGSVLGQTLGPLDLWQIATVNEAAEPQDPGSVRARDLSGTLVRASKPVALFAGVECARIPGGTPACDHLEEQIPPLTAWGRRYVLAPTQRRGTAVDHFRVLVGREGTTIHASLPLIPPTPEGGWRAGDVIAFATPNPVVLDADGPILVAQGLAGRLAGAGIGDPSFLLPAPLEQQRSSYVVLSPATYDASYVTVVAPDGVVIEVQLPPLEAAQQAVEGGPWRVAHYRVDPGRHEVRCSAPCGVSVYGWSKDEAAVKRPEQA